MGAICILIFFMSLVQLLVGSYSNPHFNRNLGDDSALNPNYTLFSEADMLLPLLTPDSERSDYEEDTSDTNEEIYEKDKNMDDGDAMNPFTYFGRTGKPSDDMKKDIAYDEMKSSNSQISNKSMGGGGGYGKIDISIQYGCCNGENKSTQKPIRPQPAPTRLPKKEIKPPPTTPKPEKNCEWNCKSNQEQVGAIEISPDKLNSQTSQNSRFEDIANVPFYLSPKRTQSQYYSDNSVLLPSSVLPPFLIEPTRPFHTLEEPPPYVFSPRFDNSDLNNPAQPQPRNTANTQQNYNQQQASMIRRYINEKKRQLHSQHQPKPQSQSQYKQPTRNQDSGIDEEHMKAYSNVYNPSTISPIQNRGKINKQPSESPSPFPGTFIPGPSADRGAVYLYGGLISPTMSVAPHAVSLAPYDRGHVHRNTFSAAGTSPSSMVSSVGPSSTPHYYGNHITPRSVLRTDRFDQQNVPRHENYEQQQQETVRFIYNNTSNHHSNGNNNNQNKYYARPTTAPIVRIEPKLTPQQDNHNYSFYDFNQAERQQSLQPTPQYQMYFNDQSNNNENSDVDDITSPNINNEDLITQNRATFNKMQFKVYDLFTQAALKDFRERLSKSIESKKIEVMDEEQAMLDKSDIPQKDINFRILDYLTIYERYSDRLNDTELRGHLLQDMERARDYLNMKLNKFWLELDTMQTPEVFLQKKNYYKSRERPPGIMNVFYNWYEDLICNPSNVNEDKIRDNLVDIMKKEKRYWLLLLKT